MLDLLCKSQRGNVFFYQKGKKKKNVCFQRRPRHQPESPSSAVQMRYTAFTAGQSRAELHPGGMRAWRCGSWPAPGSLGGKVQSVRGAQRDQQEAPVAASAVKCFCSAHTRPGPPRCAAPEGMGASPCPQWGVRILPPPPCRAGDKQGCEVSQPLWLSC